jgi:DNA-binding transcriptional LysR family regulator
VCWDAADVGALQCRPYRQDTLCVAVPQDHALATRRKLRFADTLPYEHVSLPVNSAAQLMLQRRAAALGRSVDHRVVVTNFEAALRVVRAGLAISIVPREVAQAGTTATGVRLLPLDEPWAQRRFILCFRDAASLSPAAQLLLDHLASVAPPP